MTVLELLIKAWKTSGIVAADSETPDSAQTADGLYLLNELLSEMAIDGKSIPYRTHATESLVAGQEKYPIDNLASIDALTYNDGEVRFSLVRDGVKKYFNTPRVDNISSLPSHYYAERQNGGTDIYLYFQPSKNFTLNISGLYYLSSVTKATELDDAYDEFYQGYLRYKLAERMCELYNVPYPLERRLEKLERKIDGLNSTDLLVRKSPLLKDGGFTNYGYANFTTGWYPS